MNAPTEPDPTALESRARELAAGGLFCAFAVALPMVLHAVPQGGQIFLPMHLPVLVAGLLLSPVQAMAVGLLAPWLSMLVTGMPPFPITPVMSLELLALAGAASLLTQWRVPLWLATAGAVLVRMVVTALLWGFGGRVLGVRADVTAIAMIVIGLPGVALQLVAAPAAVLTVRSRLNLADR